MTDSKFTNQEELDKIERWFTETYGSDKKSHDEVQLLILHKLYQIEERLKTVEHQTKTHWAK